MRFGNTVHVVVLLAKITQIFSEHFLTSVYIDDYYVSETGIFVGISL